MEDNNSHSRNATQSSNEQVQGSVQLISHVNLCECWSVEDPRPLIVHIIYRFDIGGLESIIVQLINQLAEEKFRHAIISLTTAGNIQNRLDRSDVPVFALAKKPGKGWMIYLHIWRLLRRLKPDLVHTYNMATMDLVISAFLAGGSKRIHAEHGRDIYDLLGENRKYILMRQLLAPFFSRIIAVSGELEQWLLNKVKLRPDKVQLIYNGVDLDLFSHKIEQRQAHLPTGFANSDSVIIGTVGRLVPVKNQSLLIQAVASLIHQSPDTTTNIRLIIVGDGELSETLQTQAKSFNIEQYIWFTGHRDDVNMLIGCMDVFVLSSLAEGIALTALEAMATGLPLVLTRVGGNPELIDDNVNGLLVNSKSPDSMAAALQRYIDDRELRLAHGRKSRQKVKRLFSRTAMIENYQQLFADVLK